MILGRKWQGLGKWRVLTAAALALVLALLSYGFWRETSWPVVVLQPQELVQSVVATATVQTRHRANVGTQVAGTVVDVKVLEGDRFRAGQVLLRLDDRERAPQSVRPISRFGRPS